MTDFIYWLGDFFYTIFGWLRFLGELFINPNVIFIVLGFVGLFFWLNKQGKYNKEAQSRGSLK
ncbi:MAG: hypothetical protein K0B10_13130 [Vicingaceae bacterium]|jgi:drug/metabolite transporter (DMT)-like permease|nr:hypothetical protein [Vicingaceae bacterium]PKP50108.1 MAG: hypothetical protein CVT95_02870 [Bacteroidetes bacterium HGW-Bacteroidetes-12]